MPRQAGTEVVTFGWEFEGDDGPTLRPPASHIEEEFTNSEEGGLDHPVMLLEAATIVVVGQLHLDVEVSCGLMTDTSIRVGMELIVRNE